MIKHRTFIFILVSMLVSAFIVSSAMASRGIVPVSIKDKSGNEIGLYKESHALVIGVSDYTNGWQDLESVPGEVNDLVSALEAQGFHVVKVLNPNSEALEKSFKDFIDQYGFDPDNRLLFFFSGHGYTRQVGKITKGYLVPTDAPIPEHDPKGFKNKALSMKQIITWAEGDIESKHALFLFDSCFSGTILTSRGKPPIPHPIKDSTNHPVRQFISAGSSGQLVPSQSVFTPYFIRALKGDGDLNRDGYVTGTELGLYLRDQIMGGDTHQTPQVGKSFNPNFNEGDFVFSLKATLLTPKASSASAFNALVEKRRKIQAERKMIETERKQFEEEKRLDEAREKLKEERKLLEVEKGKREKRLQIAKLMPGKNPPTKPSRKCPANMSVIPGGVFFAGKVKSLKEMSINAFCMDKFEVTQAQYMGRTRNNPSKFKGRTRPVERVSWHEASGYCQLMGKRLPTEWEWEKAAKAGAKTKYYWGNKPDATYAWYGEDWKRGHHPVGQKKPNAFGLYDMSGNVTEWTDSVYNGEKNKVLRGGSWMSNQHYLLPSLRTRYGPLSGNNYIGFRCAK
jgi:formylglycine-generating enzyme required for sulfatase activity